MADQGSIANLKQNINENIYDNTDYDISGGRMNTVLQNIVDTLEFNGRDFFNVNEYREKSDEYADAAAGRAAVPDEVKKIGLVITYLLADGWHIEQFIGDVLTYWTADLNWVPFNIDANNYVLTYKTDGYCYIENHTLYFKNLALWSKVNNHIAIRLRDGVHEWTSDNAISLEDNKPVYIVTYEIGDGKATLHSGTPTTKYVISLGEYSYSLQETFGGLLDNLIWQEKTTNQFESIIKETTTVRDSSLFTESGYISRIDGRESVNADCKRTDFIPVNEGDEFYYTGWINALTADGACIVGYDDNKDFVSVILDGILGMAVGYKFQKIVIPSGVSYIRACSAFLTYSPYTWVGYLIRNISDEVSKIITGEIDNILNVKYPNLNGKKVVFFGDSITAAGIYESEFQALTGCIAYNRGVGGTTYAQISQSLLWNESLADRVDLAAEEGTSSSNRGLPSNPDLIFVFAGINDWGRIAKNNETPVPAGGGSYQPADYITGERFGDMNVEDKTTFCGAVRYVLRRLKTKYPTTPIVTILPLHTYSPDQYPLWSELKYATPGTESTDWIIQKSTDDDKTLYDYRNAIRTIAGQFGIPVIDTFEMGITPILATDKAAYYNEGLHPNTAGYHLLGNFIYKQLPKEFLLKSV